MGIQFSASMPVVGWRSGCPFDERVFSEREDAVAAAADHPQGGCEQGRRWDPAGDGWGEAEWVAFRAAYDAEHERLGEWPDWCVTGMYVSPVYAEQSPEVGLSQGNGEEMLRTLGVAPAGYVDPMEFPYAGSMPADEFLGRVLTALALDPGDPGRPSSVERGAGGATLIDCGRAVGYRAEVLNRLHELAEWAREREFPVCWS